MYIYYFRIRFARLAAREQSKCTLLSPAASLCDNSAECKWNATSNANWCAPLALRSICIHRNIVISNESICRYAGVPIDRFDYVLSQCSWPLFAPLLKKFRRYSRDAMLQFHLVFRFTSTFTVFIFRPYYCSRFSPILRTDKRRNHSRITNCNRKMTPNFHVP